MAYGKPLDELLQNGDQSVEQVVADGDSHIAQHENTPAREPKVTEGDPNPAVVDTSAERPADAAVKVKETEGGGLRAVVEHDEDPNAVLAKGQDKEAEQVAEDGGNLANEKAVDPKAKKKKSGSKDKKS